MLKHLPWIFMLVGLCVALLVVSREGRLAEAGSPSRVCVAVGQQVLGLIFGSVFTFSGFFIGAVLQGCLRKLKDFGSEWKRLSREDPPA
jgi:hypothetical protein